MRLYRKEKQWHDFWEIHINFPWMGKRFAPHPPHHALGGLEYGFSFPTKCCLYIEDEYYWTFSLRILGLGVTTIRQNGY
jgi:hypothetical protein